MKPIRRMLLALLVLLIPGSVFSEEPQDKDKGKGPFSGLEYRLIGPAAGGRVSRVAGVPRTRLSSNEATSASSSAGSESRYSAAACSALSSSSFMLLLVSINSACTRGRGLGPNAVTGRVSPSSRTST